MKNTLEIKNITCSYAKKPVVENFSLKLKEGEHIALTGENGRGKTTILKTAAGLLRPDEGSVRIFGIEINNEYKQESSKRYLPKLSFVFQNPSLQIIGSTPFEDLIFGLKNLNIKRKEAETRAEKQLIDLEITHLKNVATFSLSGGEAQLVAFAGAIITRPKLLFLDEPTSMLDEEHKIKITNSIDCLKQEGTAILSVSHDAHLLNCADEVICL